jgi:CelD/BcsL family acetyltransferase involved in cellulose biosynthesis
MSVDRVIRLPLGPAREAPAQALVGHVPRISTIPCFEAVVDEWTRLAATGGDVFATWEWATTWWDHFGAGRQLDLAGCYDEESRLAGILPLYTSSVGPFSVTRLIGYPVGSRSHLICAPADRAAIAGGLVAALRHRNSDLFIGEGLPADEGWDRHIEGAVVASVPSPTLSLESYSAWNDYLASRSSSFRKMLRHEERALQRDHGLAFRRTTSFDELECDLDTFIALHFDRWATGSNLLRGSRIAFHRAFARVALERGWLRLWFLELDDKPVAAWYGFRFGGVDTYYQAGRASAPLHRGRSLGTVLIAHTIREALADGITEYRFGPGGGAYKYRFTDDDPGLQTLVLPMSVLGRSAVRLQRVTSGSRTLRRVVARIARSG